MYRWCEHCSARARVYAGAQFLPPCPPPSPTHTCRITSAQPRTERKQPADHDNLGRLTPPLRSSGGGDTRRVLLAGWAILQTGRESHDRTGVPASRAQAGAHLRLCVAWRERPQVRAGGVVAARGPRTCSAPPARGPGLVSYSVADPTPPVMRLLCAHAIQGTASTPMTGEIAFFSTLPTKASPRPRPRTLNTPACVRQVSSATYHA